jgi:hypothetical protein
MEDLENDIIANTGLARREGERLKCRSFWAWKRGSTAGTIGRSGVRGGGLQPDMFDEI